MSKKEEKEVPKFRPKTKKIAISKTVKLKLKNGEILILKNEFPTQLNLF